MNNVEIVSQPDNQFLRIKDVAKLTTLSKSSINLWVAQGRFPAPITLSKTVKIWHLKDVLTWAEGMKKQ